MRVRNTWNAEVSPCGGFFGEVEDYTILVDDEVSTDEKTVSPIQLYPNPTAEVVLFKNEGPADGAFLEIYQSTGQHFLSKKITGRQQQLSVVTWPRGIYFVFVKDANGSNIHFEKLVIN